MNAPISPDQPLSPPPAGLVTDFNHPQDDERYRQIVITMPIVVAFSTLCVLARLYARAFIVKRFGWDDFFALLALICNFGLTYCWVGEIRTGLTDYDWNVRALEWMANDLPTWYTYNAVGAILLWWGVGFIKLSVLSLYLRLLGSTRAKLRMGCYVMMVVTFLISFICMVDLLTFCQPVTKVFHFDEEGTCNVQPTLFFAQALLNMLTDVCILVPPIPIIWQLSTSTSRKWGFSLVLSLGLFVTCIALARTIFVSPNILGPQYQLYSQFNNSYWALLEVNSGIAVVCLPALSQLFHRIWRATRGRKAMHVHHGAAMDVVVDDTPEVASAGSDPSTPREERDRGRGRKKQRSPISQVVSRFLSDIGRSHTDNHDDNRTAHDEKSVGESDSVGRSEGSISAATAATGEKQGEPSSSAAGKAATTDVRELTLIPTAASNEGNQATESHAHTDDGVPDAAQMV